MVKHFYKSEQNSVILMYVWMKKKQKENQFQKDQSEYV